MVHKEWEKMKGAKGSNCRKNLNVYKWAMSETNSSTMIVILPQHPQVIHTHLSRRKMTICRIARITSKIQTATKAQ